MLIHIKVQNRLRESKPEAKPVLKIRLLDINGEAHFEEDKPGSGAITSGVLSLWNPGSLTEMLKEGNVLGIVGAQVRFYTYLGG